MGVDPGSTSGVCLVRNGRLEWGLEVRDLSAMVDLVGSWCPDVDLIVMEDFIGSGAAKNYFDPVAIIGAVVAVAYLQGVPLVMQAPSCQMRFRDALKSTHSSRHVRSALAHVLYWCRAHAA